MDNRTYQATRLFRETLTDRLDVVFINESNILHTLNPFITKTAPLHTKDLSTTFGPTGKINAPRVGKEQRPTIRRTLALAFCVVLCCDDEEMAIDRLEEIKGLLADSEKKPWIILITPPDITFTSELVTSAVETHMTIQLREDNTIKERNTQLLGIIQSALSELIRKTTTLAKPFVLAKS